MFPNADRDSLAVYFLAHQRLQAERQRPISVDDGLPDVESVPGKYMRSDIVMAYSGGEYPGWSSAVYTRTPNGDYWEYAAEGVSGYEWEVDKIEHVMHWTPLPPPPDEW